MTKWRLLVSTLPIVACVLVAVALRDHVLGYHGFIDFGDVGPVLTAGAFLIGFMMSGVMSDYKESEKLPAELACTLETIEEHLVLASVKAKVDTRTQLARLQELAELIEAWLFQERPVDDVLAAIGHAGAMARELDRGGSFYSGKILGELANLRKTVTRIHVISSTSFLPAGYALLDTVVAAVMVMLLCARWKSEVAEYTLVTCISLVYIYLMRLVRDVDSPLEHTRGGQKGAAEVDLGALTAYVARAAGRRAADANGLAAVAA